MAFLVVARLISNTYLKREKIKLLTGPVFYTLEMGKIFEEKER